MSDQNQFAARLMCTLLTKALKGLSNIRNIILDASVVTGIDRRFEPWHIRSFFWGIQWPRAFQAWQVLLTAATHSRSQLDSLAVFQKENTKKCSIPVHEIPVTFIQKLEEEGFAEVGSRLKSYSISLAMTPQLDRGEDLKRTLEDMRRGMGMESPSTDALATNDNTAHSKVDFEGVSYLLKLMPNLESLQINMYPGDLNDSVSEYDEFLPTLLRENWRFPHLKELRLLGVCSSQEDLQELITRHAATLQVLSLENLVLTSGSWEPIFATLSQQATSLVSLRLALLGVGEGRIGVNLEPADLVSHGLVFDFWLSSDQSIYRFLSLWYYTQNRTMLLHP